MDNCSCILPSKRRLLVLTFEEIFIDGFLPVPYLIDVENKFPKARMWNTAYKDGGIKVIDENGNVINTIERYKKIIGI